MLGFILISISQCKVLIDKRRFFKWQFVKINELMHTSRRGSCCDGNNLGTRLKQPTIWTVAETELVSQKMHQRAISQKTVNSKVFYS